MRGLNLLPRRLLAFLAIAAFPGPAAMQGDDLVATAGSTVLKTGPRAGDNGGNYFNIQGKASGEDGKYASFGVLDFPAPKGGDARGMTLTLVQSVARFSKDGKVKFYLAADLKAKPTKTLRFDAATVDGLGEQLLPRHPLGKGTFLRAKTGQVDRFALSLDEGARAFVKAQVAGGRTLRIVVVPDDGAVAATYFGAGSDTPANRPKLTIDRDSTP